LAKRRIDHVGGWPRPRAFAAALLLHLVVLALLVLSWRPAPDSAAPKAVAVSLVVAPPPKPATALPPKPAAAPPVPLKPARQPPPGAPSLPLEGSSAPPAVRAAILTPGKLAPPAPSAEPAPAREPAPPPPRPKPQRPAARAEGKPGRPAVEAHVEPGVAIYSVTVEKAGQIGAITLLQSSGTPDFDRAGEAMIRNATMFQPPPASGDHVRYFSVTIRFTPKPH
jgi:TonB family protein